MQCIKTIYIKQHWNYINKFILHALILYIICKKNAQLNHIENSKKKLFCMFQFCILFVKKWSIHISYLNYKKRFWCF